MMWRGLLLSPLGAVVGTYREALVIPVEFCLGPEVHGRSTGVYHLHYFSENQVTCVLMLYHQSTERRLSIWIANYYLWWQREFHY